MKSCPKNIRFSMKNIRNCSIFSGELLRRSGRRGQLAAALEATLNFSYSSYGSPGKFWVAVISLSLTVGRTEYELESNESLEFEKDAKSFEEHGAFNTQEHRYSIKCTYSTGTHGIGKTGCSIHQSATPILSRIPRQSLPQALRLGGLQIFSETEKNICKNSCRDVNDIWLLSDTNIITK